MNSKTKQLVQREGFPHPLQMVTANMVQVVFWKDNLLVSKPEDHIQDLMDKMDADPLLGFNFALLVIKE